MTTRRRVLQAAIGGAAVAGGGLAARLARAALPSGTVSSAVLATLPGKQPLLKRSFRPPNYETPVSGFAEAITPNDRFFVRWHLSEIPQIDASTWKLSVGGDAASRPYDLTFDQLKHDFDPVELIAGELPRRQQRLVEAWAELHQEELLADWARLQAGQTPLPIDPLEG